MLEGSDFHWDECLVQGQVGEKDIEVGSATEVAKRVAEVVVVDTTFEPVDLQLPRTSRKQRFCPPQSVKVFDQGPVKAVSVPRDRHCRVLRPLLRLVGFPHLDPMYPDAAVWKLGMRLPDEIPVSLGQDRRGLTEDGPELPRL